MNTKLLYTYAYIRLSLNTGLILNHPNLDPLTCGNISESHSKSWIGESKKIYIWLPKSYSTVGSSIMTHGVMECILPSYYLLNFISLFGIEHRPDNRILSFFFSFFLFFCLLISSQQLRSTYTFTFGSFNSCHFFYVFTLTLFSRNCNNWKQKRRKFCWGNLNIGNCFHVTKQRGWAVSNP